ncbi:hypothetical protein AVEN_212880-1 [Araneus ventricosus]|uniref:Retrotransposon gag domain-containing protein n=1 Tax=Araneus ventricosus TaxID=182803 RepID=A0A4Y2F467_ARAVE|nr:hypothetical protein AVEN_212880-1 [Araneus ventricosus]
MVEGDTEAKATPPTSSTYITCQLPQEPCCFSGLSTEDAEKWKNDYERIANYNHWDDSVRLANVVFYLSGTARLWFDNNEDQFKNWSDFERLFKSGRLIFGVLPIMYQWTLCTVWVREYKKNSCGGINKTIGL